MADTTEEEAQAALDAGKVSAKNMERFLAIGKERNWNLTPPKAPPPDVSEQPYNSPSRSNARLSGMQAGIPFFPQIRGSDIADRVRSVATATGPATGMGVGVGMELLGLGEELPRAAGRGLEAPLMGPEQRTAEVRQELGRAQAESPGDFSTAKTMTEMLPFLAAGPLMSGVGAGALPGMAKAAAEGAPLARVAGGAAAAGLEAALVGGVQGAGDWTGQGSFTEGFEEGGVAGMVFGGAAKSIGEIAKRGKVWMKKAEDRLRVMAAGGDEAKAAEDYRKMSGEFARMLREGVKDHPSTKISGLLRNPAQQREIAREAKDIAGGWMEEVVETMDRAGPRVSMYPAGKRLKLLQQALHYPGGQLPTHQKAAHKMLQEEIDLIEKQPFMTFGEADKFVRKTLLKGKLKRGGPNPELDDETVTEIRKQAAEQLTRAVQDYGDLMVIAKWKNAKQMYAVSKQVIRAGSKQLGEDISARRAGVLAATGVGSALLYGLGGEWGGSLSAGSLALGGMGAFGMTRGRAMGAGSARALKVLSYGVEPLAEAVSRPGIRTGLGLGIYGPDRVYGQIKVEPGDDVGTAAEQRLKGLSKIDPDDIDDVMKDASEGEF